jgi:hypothetical protein
VNEFLEKYTKGWADDDLDMLLAGCADDFVYDDPYDGRITKAAFADYYRGLPDGDGGFTEEMEQESDGLATALAWWHWKPEGAAEWTQEGSALTKADSEGVHSTRVAYYKHLPDLPPAR